MVRSLRNLGIAICSALVLTLVVPAYMLMHAPDAVDASNQGLLDKCLESIDSVLRSAAISGGRVNATSHRPGPEFANATRIIRNEARQSKDFESGISRMQALVPCNPQQQRQKELNIEGLGWQAASEACREAYYYPLREGGTFGGVGKWLACIGPVNQAYIAVSRERSQAYAEMLRAPCSEGYEPPQEAHVPLGKVYADVVNAVAQIEEIIDLTDSLLDRLSMLDTLPQNADMAGSNYVTSDSGHRSVYEDLASTR